MPRPKHHEASDEVMDCVASELGVAEVFHRTSRVRNERVRWAARMVGKRAVACESAARARACARASSAPEQGNEIAMDSSG
jgi:hypothetical protein